MKAHNPILFDFDQCSITLQRQGKPVVLYGIGDYASQLQLLQCKDARKLTHKRGSDFNSPLFSVQVSECPQTFLGCEALLQKQPT